MSLPSGLIFFLDFIKSPDKRGADGSSIYGGNKVGSAIQTGVNLGDAANGTDAGGFYDFNTGFAHATSSVAAALDGTQVAAVSGFNIDGTTTDITAVLASEAARKIVDYDPDLLSLAAGTKVLVIDTDKPSDLNIEALSAVRLEDKDGVITVDDKNVGANVRLSLGTKHVRRLTKITSAGKLRLVFINTARQIGPTAVDGTTGLAPLVVGDDGIALHSYPKMDQLQAVSGGIGAVNVLGTDGTSHELENAADMAEIDIKVDSIAVTAQTKKLKAKWSPELGQDLNAYHNLDAEVELTGILSEQIALEIDRELLGDLVHGATAGTRYWSRAPGLFVDSSGAEIGHASAAPDFTGTVSEWYETLIETINDVSAQIHRKTLRGGANFVVCSPEVANILEFTSGFRASVTADQDRGTIGAVKSGSLSKKFDVYVDPYFVRNVILVGRKGSSFLESGFVYAPYVPLQVTPTIFGTEDFVPRKGVMTRYAKKMVRPDMYGLVVVRGLLGEAGK
jgi:hypothetical protein